MIGAVAEQMHDTEKALAAFENALRHNPNSLIALNGAAQIARGKDDFDKAIDYFQRVLNIKQDNGEVWGSMGKFKLSYAQIQLSNMYMMLIYLGHCLLMKDDLPKAYTAYQQALYHLQNPKVSPSFLPLGMYESDRS